MDLYQVLEVSRHASRRDIVRAYRRLALIHHPDRHVAKADTPTATIPDAIRFHQECFARISAAYDTLEDPMRRAAYDAAQGGRTSRSRNTQRTTARPPRPTTSTPRSRPQARRQPRPAPGASSVRRRVQQQNFLFKVGLLVILSLATSFTLRSLARQRTTLNLVGKEQAKLIAKSTARYHEQLERKKYGGFKSAMEFGAHIASQPINRTHYQFDVMQMTPNGTLEVLHRKGDPTKVGLTQARLEGTSAQQRQRKQERDQQRQRQKQQVLARARRRNHDRNDTTTQHAFASKQQRQRTEAPPPAARSTTRTRRAKLPRPNAPT